MADLRALFSTGSESSDDAHYAKLRAQSMYPDLIGRKVEGDRLTPCWMRCTCGMLVMTTRALSKVETVCDSCVRNSETVSPTSGVPAARPLSKRGESRVLFALVVFCLIVIGAIGLRVMDAPPRAQAAEGPRLD